MVYTIRDLVGDASCQSGTTFGKAFGKWSRTIPLPVPGGYLRGAWGVLRGRAVAVRYPRSGDLEQALADSGGIRVDATSKGQE